MFSILTELSQSHQLIIRATAFNTVKNATVPQ